MTSFGDELRAAREARDISLDAIARVTRIPRRHLEALELGRFDLLPGNVFARGFLRSYAECLGVDPEAWLGALEEATAPCEEPDVVADPARIARARARDGGARAFRAAALVALVAAVVGVSVWWARSGGPADLEPPSPERRTARLLPPPEPAPAPTSTPEEIPKLAVPNHGLGTNVVDRALAGRSDRFFEGTEVWFWTRVVGGEPGDAVRHVWYREGRAVMAAELPIEAPHWRTYSRLVLPRGSAGRWTVEVRTLDGRRLARDEFDCLAEETDAPR